MNKKVLKVAFMVAMGGKDIMTLSLKKAMWHI